MFTNFTRPDWVKIKKKLIADGQIICMVIAKHIFLFKKYNVYEYFIILDKYLHSTYLHYHFYSAENAKKISSTKL